VGTALVVLLAACGGSDIVAPGDGSGAGDPSGGDPSSGGSVSFVNDVHSLLVSKGCTAGNCHGGDAGGLTLTSSASGNYGNLVGASSSCGSLLLVKAGDAAASYLVQKLEGTHACGGSRMPVGSGSLTQAEIGKIRAWIDGGAPSN
jgi:hypothetical protein